MAEKKKVSHICLYSHLLSIEDKRIHCPAHQICLSGQQVPNQFLTRQKKSRWNFKPPAFGTVREACLDDLHQNIYLLVRPLLICIEDKLNIFLISVASGSVNTNKKLKEHVV